MPRKGKITKTPKISRRTRENDNGVSPVRGSSDLGKRGTSSVLSVIALIFFFETALMLFMFWDSEKTAG